MRKGAASREQAQTSSTSNSLGRQANGRPGAPPGVILLNDLASKDLASKDLASKDLASKDLASKDLASHASPLFGCRLFWGDDGGAKQLKGPATARTLVRPAPPLRRPAVGTHPGNSPYSLSRCEKTDMPSESLLENLPRVSRAGGAGPAASGLPLPLRAARHQSRGRSQRQPRVPRSSPTALL